MNGELDICCQGFAGNWQKLGPEEAFYIAPDARHAVRNNATAAAELLTVTAMRMLRFFKMIGSEAITAEPQPTCPEELAALAGRITAYDYGIVIRVEDNERC